MGGGLYAGLLGMIPVCIHIHVHTHVHEHIHMYTQHSYALTHTYIPHTQLTHNTHTQHSQHSQHFLLSGPHPPPTPPHPPHSHMAAATTNALVMLYNKHVFLQWGFHFTPAVVLAQLVVSSLVLTVIKQQGMAPIPAWSREMVRRYLPLSMAYAISSLMALVALERLPLLVYVTVKRCNVIAVLGVKLIVFGAVAGTGRSLWAVVIAVGAMIASAAGREGPLWPDPIGLAAILTSIVARASHLLLISSRTSGTMSAGVSGPSKDPPLTIMYFSTVLAIPPMAGVVYFVTEMEELMAYPHWGNAHFQGALCVFLAEGILMQVLLLLCASHTSALTTAVVSNVKLPMVTLLSFLLFGSADFLHTNLSLSFFGMGISTLGGIGYSYVSLFPSSPPSTLVTKVKVSTSPRGDPSQPIQPSFSSSTHIRRSPSQDPLFQEPQP